MARPIRIDIQGGWYHVMSRGIEQRTIFAGADEYEHFLELIEEMSQRYAVEVHAYCLMRNHYHLLIRTPQANASRAVQWLNVSYSVWFNRRRKRVGHVFQGRFKSILIDGAGSWASYASIYVHLNLVRTAEYGLGKSNNAAERAGLKVADRNQLKERLKALRDFAWSSYRGYAGYGPAEKWLATKEILRRSGGQKKYRKLVQQYVTRGIDPEGLEDLAGRVMIGTQAFIDKVKKLARAVSKEQPQRKEVACNVDIGRIIRIVEKEKGETWEKFSDRHGDWGRDLVLYLARKRSGLGLREIGEAVGIAEYKSVGKAVQRFEESLKHDNARRETATILLEQLSHVET